MDTLFEWDEAKAISNLQKHGVSFEEGTTIFTDVHARTIFDTAYTADEERFIDIGQSAYGRILVVVYTEHYNRIRLISCRKATSHERKHYEQHQ